MPGFVGHTIGNTVVLAGTMAYMVSQGWSTADILATGTGVALATVILSPDMDLFNSRSMKEWGILRFYWWPYAKLVKHRDGMHVPLIGTFVRWAYNLVLIALAIVPIAILLRRVGFSMTFKGETDDILWYLGYLVDAFVGATLADTMHYVLDVTTTHIKTRLIPRKQRERYARYVQNHYDHDHRLPMRQQSLNYKGERE
ncbi:MAG: DUF2227 family putative metal-binding protein [Chloroflexi bacterium]|nr:DUF2227 family putative metal-binding protein [Chloroflexota bacterium]